MTTKTTVTPAADDRITLVTQFFPDIYTQITPPQGESKRRRRRKKNRGESNGGGMKKRKLSEEQVHLLEFNFGNEHKLESERKDRIAAELGLDPRQVAVWFQNRRARWKNKKLEDEYLRLKKAHDSVVVEKCGLESEVIKLKDQLCEAEKEIGRLSDRGEIISSKNSPNSCVSTDVMDQSFIGEFRMENCEDVFNLLENNYVSYMEWLNQYM